MNTSIEVWANGKPIATNYPVEDLLTLINHLTFNKTRWKFRGFGLLEIFYPSKEQDRAVQILKEVLA